MSLFDPISPFVSESKAFKHRTKERKRRKSCTNEGCDRVATRRELCEFCYNLYVEITGDYSIFDQCCFDRCDRVVDKRGGLVCKKHDYYCKKMDPNHDKFCEVDGCRYQIYSRKKCKFHWKTMPSVNVCSVEGCNRTYYAKSYCQMHYARVRAHGDPLVAHRDMQTNTLTTKCKVEGCDRIINRYITYGYNGYCGRHASQVQRNGKIVSVEPATTRQGGECIAPFCKEKAISKGRCSKHYSRNYEKNFRKPRRKRDGSQRS